MLSTILTFLGTVLGIAFTFVASRDEISFKMRLAFAVVGILVLAGTILGGIDNSRTTQEILSLSKANVELSSKNISLNEKVTGISTGGNSYCYLAIQPTSGNTTIGLIAIRGDQYPLYDLKVKVLNLTKWYAMHTEFIKEMRALGTKDSDNSNITSVDPKHQSRMGSKMEAIEKECVTRYSIGNISSTDELQSIKLELKRPLQRYQITFSARNGKWTQQIVLHYVTLIKGFPTWTAALKVERNSEIIEEQVWNGYPKGENGEIDWKPEDPLDLQNGEAIGIIR